jgi:hypothetical protein
MADASDTMQSAQSRNNRNIRNYEKAQKQASDSMERLGLLELKVSKDFERFADAFEKIHNRPDFSTLKFNASVPVICIEDIRISSIASKAVIGAATGVTLGTIAALGVNAAAASVGTAATGTIAAVVSGAAITKAFAIASSGVAVASGGAVVGTAVVGAATFGIGILVGGAVFAFTGAKLSSKADEAYDAMLRNESCILKGIESLNEIESSSEELHGMIDKVYAIYNDFVGKFTLLVERETNWESYNFEEHLLIENNVRIVSILHKLINTPMLKVTESDRMAQLTKTELDRNSVKSAIDVAVSAVSHNRPEVR